MVSLSGFLCFKSAGRPNLRLRCVCSRKRASKYFPKIHNEELCSNIISKCAVFYLLSKRKYETCVSCVVLGNDREVYLVYKMMKNSTI